MLESVSRVRDGVISAEHLEAANMVLRAEAAYRSHEDLIAVGAYRPGADRLVDAAIALRPEMLAFLIQRPGDRTSFEESAARLQAIAHRLHTHQTGRAAA